MTELDIERYLTDNQDNNGLSDWDILLLVEKIHRRLDYSGLFEQIDNLAQLLKNDPDYPHE